MRIDERCFLLFGNGMELNSELWPESRELGAWSLEPGVRTTSRSRGKCSRRTRSRSWISNWRCQAMCRNAIELDEIEFAASCSGFDIRIRIRIRIRIPIRIRCFGILAVPCSFYHLHSCLQFVVFEHAKMRFGLHSPNILDLEKFSIGLLCCLRFSLYFCRFFLPFFLGPELWQIFMQCCMSSDLPWWHADGISGTGQAAGGCLQRQQELKVWLFLQCIGISGWGISLFPYISTCPGHVDLLCSSVCLSDLLTEALSTKIGNGCGCLVFGNHGAGFISLHWYLSVDGFRFGYRFGCILCPDTR